MLMGNPHIRRYCKECGGITEIKKSPAITTAGYQMIIVSLLGIIGLMTVAIAIR